LHVTIDDHLRAGCGLILRDETTRSAVRFTIAALRCYKAPGVRITGTMTDNGSAY